MEFHKTIIQGRIEFGNEKSYDKVFKMFEYRTDSYYKSDIIIVQEEVFNKEILALEVPRYVGQHLEKTYRNTVSLLQYCAQFAVSGEIRAWQTGGGKVRSYAYIEPESDKAAVISFRKGKDLASKDGREQEALEALSEAIEKYNRHAYAYEKRGEVNYILKKYHDSLRDFNKCLAIDDSIPDAYMGRANIALKDNDLQTAIENLDTTIKKSIALQAIYWKARKLKMECHLKLGEYEKAAFDLKLLSSRKFKEQSPHFKLKKFYLTQYALVLVELEKFLEALAVFKEAETITTGKKINEAEFLYFRGIAKKKAGKTGHLKDIKKAAELGEKRATAFIAAK